MKKIFRKILSRILYISGDAVKVRNIVLWPMSKRLLGYSYEEIIDIGDNIKMTVYSDIMDRATKDLMYFSGFVNYAWEPFTVRLFIKLLGNKKNIVIAGGHLGYYALIGAKLNKDAKVFAFEPVPAMHKRMIKNKQLNDLSNMLCERKAVSNANGPLEIADEDGQSFVVSGGKNKSPGATMADGVKLDTFFGNHKGQPDLILLDVEGYENFVFDGADKILENNNLEIIFEINPKMYKKAGVKISTVAEKLENKGYRLFFIEDDYDFLDLKKDYSVPVLKDFNQNVYENFNGSFANVLATRRTNQEIEEMGVVLKISLK